MPTVKMMIAEVMDVQQVTTYLKGKTAEWEVQEASRQATRVLEPPREEPARPTKPSGIKLRRQEREQPETATTTHQHTTKDEDLEEEEEHLQMP